MGIIYRYIYIYIYTHTHPLVVDRLGEISRGCSSCSKLLVNDWYKVVPQCGMAKLLNIAPIMLGFMVDISS